MIQQQTQRQRELLTKSATDYHASFTHSQRPTPRLRFLWQNGKLRMDSGGWIVPKERSGILRMYCPNQRANQHKLWSPHPSRWGGSNHLHTFVQPPRQPVICVSNTLKQRLGLYIDTSLTNMLGVTQILRHYQPQGHLQTNFYTQSKCT